MKFDGKSRRMRERLRLTLPVRVHCRESVQHEWVEFTRLADVTPFGARFRLAHPTEWGRLLHLTLPMPRQLRCFDHVEDQYRVWALVRHVRPQIDKAGAPSSSELRFDVGVAFTGKRPPTSYLNQPATLYDIETLSPEHNLWMLREETARDEEKRSSRNMETRLQMAINVLIEVFDDQGRASEREQTVTENISRRGAAVWTTLGVERGRFVRVTSSDHGLTVIAVVRARRPGADGIQRLHLEFVDQQWPLEGIE
ncbi:MAG: ESX-1 secretion-associated protein [Acidobacteria bacterium]|nr:ESX-1 secretion-associated protein [Acidobacteriota bacterium]